MVQVAVEQDDYRLASTALIVREALDEHRAVVEECILGHTAVRSSPNRETERIDLVVERLRSCVRVGEPDREARRQLDFVALGVCPWKLDGTIDLGVLSAARCLGLVAVDNARRHRALDSVARATKYSWINCTEGCQVG